jgi:hypothetical protein
VELELAAVSRQQSELAGNLASAMAERAKKAIEVFEHTYCTPI